MPAQPKALTHQVNAHGTKIRHMTVYTKEFVTELSFQFVENSWVPFKRVVHSVH
ncbi:hypothetical protein [Alkalimarinus alittae]|uniref:Uncharacterized protein n=1 Tax=Alkalimarinus alittae TaxID=2961619 RepID=A0ABY6N5K8_9ALTE|nr:hypothetical protein [Alkalimarinus alittae]UZE97267.1 hypothetical protein NKI27_05820 [Alkalimarinus alittae]